MKKSQELSRKTWKLIIKNLIVMAVFVAAAIIGVMAWFSTDTSTSASGVSVECMVPDGLEIAIKEPGATPVESDWQSAETIVLNSTNFSFLADLNFSQVTGDGKTFIAPYLGQDSGIAVVDTASAWDSSKIQAIANQDYLSFDLYMRTKAENKKVILKTDTYCGPDNPKELFQNDGNKINANSVIGAVRVSTVNFTSFEGTTLGNRSLFWIPAPHIYYAYDRIWTGLDGDQSTPDIQKAQLKSSSNTYGLAKNINSTTLALTPYYLDNNFNGTYNHKYYWYNSSNSEKDHGYILYGNNKADNVTANNKMKYELSENVDLSTLNNKKTYSGTTYRENKSRVNVWIEGEDPEARAAQVAGAFKFILKLDLVDN